MTTKRATIRRIQNLALLFLASSLATSMSGCGSSSHSTTAVKNASVKSAAKGQASFTITWPKRKASSRLIPIDAASIQIVVFDNANRIVAAPRIERPASGVDTATVTVSNLSGGVYGVTATAYPNADGSGVAQAQAQTTVTIVPDQIATVDLAMMTTITALDIAPRPTILTVGQTFALTATAKDADGNVVLVSPSTLQWTSSAPTTATVDATGNVHALTTGPVNLTATETESSTSARLSLMVTTPATPLTGEETVAYQINPSHTGSVSFGKPLVFPNAPAWSVDLGAPVSYPLIVGGKVFVTTSNPSGAYGTQLYALDETTGKTVWGPIAIPGTYFWSTLAYDNGRIFTVNADGLMDSFDATSGSLVWSVNLPGQYYVNAAPTAANGILYISSASGGNLFAINESDGSVFWRTHVENGSESSPAISFNANGTNSGVYASYIDQVYGFDAESGASLWHYNGSSSGGSGVTTIYANGLLYARGIPFAPSSVGTIYDAKSGQQIGTFNSDAAPAIGTKTGFFLKAGNLQGMDLASQKALWNFTGDGQLTSNPLVINDQAVVVGSGSGTVFALDAATGSVIWTGSTGAGVGYSIDGSSEPLAGMGAGEGYLVVPARSRITAWHIVGQ